MLYSVRIQRFHEARSDLSDLLDECRDERIGDRRSAGSGAAHRLSERTRTRDVGKAVETMAAKAPNSPDIG
jgi:hypothetical protein